MLSTLYTVVLHCCSTYSTPATKVGHSNKHQLTVKTLGAISSRPILVLVVETPCIMVCLTLLFDCVAMVEIRNVRIVKIHEQLCSHPHIRSPTVTVNNHFQLIVIGPYCTYREPWSISRSSPPRHIRTRDGREYILRGFCGIQC
jgi:hypothetical protein